MSEYAIELALIVGGIALLLWIPRWRANRVEKASVVLLVALAGSILAGVIYFANAGY